MNRLRILAIVVIAVVAGWSSPAAADVESWSIVVDPREGLAWLTAEVSCTPGDDVEIDAFITQERGGQVLEAHVELFGPCPSDGVFTQTDASFESERLRPGRATVDLHERHYCQEFGFAPCLDEQSSHDASLRAGRAGG